MRKLFGIGVLALGMAAFTVPAIAADGAAIYKAKCVACHGADGQGTAMAPGFKGSEWVKSTADADIATVITNGREGAAKAYKNFAMGMPKQKLSDDEVKAVVEHLKGLAAK
ncbi:MAG: cytochrome c [Candidatus Methylomirabilis sp.]|nr:cytochrome c [Deltaproteobacteria bacterium]